MGAGGGTVQKMGPRIPPMLYRTLSTLAFCTGVQLLPPPPSPAWPVVTASILAPENKNQRRIASSTLRITYNEQSTSDVCDGRPRQDTLVRLLFPFSLLVHRDRLMLHCCIVCVCRSKRWLQRQSSDPFVKQARLEQYRSRAAFKLLEIDERLGGFLKPKSVVVRPLKDDRKHNRDSFRLIWGLHRAGGRKLRQGKCRPM